MWLAVSTSMPLCEFVGMRTQVCARTCVCVCVCNVCGVCGVLLLLVVVVVCVCVCAGGGMWWHDCRGARTGYGVHPQG